MSARPLAALRRRPRLAGGLLALAIGAAYLGAVRPLRVALAHRVAVPLLEEIGTVRAESFELTTRRGAATVYAFPTSRGSSAGGGVAHWSSPAGALFVLPAMFLAGAFPFRPYWLVLLGYHLAVGVLAAAVFALGLGWAPWAFALSAFAQTYLLETVSLAVPLLLWLAGRAEGQSPAAEAAT